MYARCGVTRIRTHAPPEELVGEAGELALARHGHAVERLLLLQAQRVEEALDGLLPLLLG